MGQELEWGIGQHLVYNSILINFAYPTSGGQRTFTLAPTVRSIHELSLYSLV